MDSDASRQRRLVEALGHPAIYPDRPPAVERIDTHSAYVFLAGAHAYKLKRAVRYPFLDYSTAELRRQSCEAEVRLNRRTAPALYEGVAPVTEEASGRLSIDGSGRPVDWLVVMRRFDSDALLDRVAARGGVTRDLSVRLADSIARFHAQAIPTPHHGGTEGMREVVDDNVRALRAAPAILDGERVELLARGWRLALDWHADQLESRRAGGFVRQCHGDLHLRNIVLLDGGPVPFDAIEFNDAFACIDVWYDLAFLLMDMERRGLALEANVLFNQYLLRTSDVGGLTLLPFFQGCRAAVRCKTSLASASLESEAARRRHHESRAREYLALAERLGAEPVPPRLVAIGGHSGVGKSTVAARLAPLLGALPGAVLLRSDVIRKILHHHDPEERLSAEAYTADATRTVYRALSVRAADVLRFGGCVVVDATFLSPETRKAIAAVARQAGATFIGIWLDAPENLLVNRLHTRPPDASDATADVLAEQMRQRVGDPSWHRLDASGTVDTVVDAVRAVLGLPDLTHEGRRADH
jgi:aminoglycoside phosphotransferase family enzyme/predicted kinase